MSCDPPAAEAQGIEQTIATLCGILPRQARRGVDVVALKDVRRVRYLTGLLWAAHE